MSFAKFVSMRKARHQKLFSHYAGCCSDLHVLLQPKSCEEKFVEIFLDDISCKASGEGYEQLRDVNSVEKNIQFTIEKPNDKGYLAFFIST